MKSVAFSVLSCWFLIGKHVSFSYCLLNSAVRKWLIETTTSVDMTMSEKVPKARFAFKINVKSIKEKK